MKLSINKRGQAISALIGMLIAAAAIALISWVGSWIYG